MNIQNKQEIPDVFRLGDWSVDSNTHRLHQGSVVRSLQMKTMQVLLELVRYPNQVVSKDHLIDTVWAERFVVEGVLKRCISDLRKALDDDSQSPKYIETIPKLGYRLIAKIEEAVGVEISLDSVSNRLKHDKVFMGLDTYRYSDAEIFFGRDQAIREVELALLSKKKSGLAFVLILGMSGVGKSSLVRAGVVPKLMSAGQHRRTVFRHSRAPGDVFDGLASVLILPEAVPELRSTNFGKSELASALRNTPNEVAAKIKDLITQDSNLYLVLDQLEELFSLPRMTTSERIAFFATIKQLASCEQIFIIATMRSDFYHRCAEIKTLVELKSDAGQYDLAPPTPSELRQIIEKPVSLAGLKYEIDSSTSRSLANDLTDAAAQHPEALPLLGFTLQELYERRKDNTLSFEAYHALGGFVGGLGRRAEEIFRGLRPKVQEALPTVLEQLVTINSGNENTFTAKPVLRSDLPPDESVQNLIDAFIDGRLFLTHLVLDGSGRIIRLAHEALLLYWDRAKNWLDENARLIQLHQRLKIAADHWHNENKHSDLLLPVGWQLDEAEFLENTVISLSDTEEEFISTSRKRANQNRYWRTALISSLAALSMTALGALFFANQNKQIAQQQSIRAEAEASAANRTLSLLANIFELSDPGNKRQETITPKELLDAGASSLQNEFTDQPLTQATLLNTIGSLYRKRGHYDESRTALELAAGKRQEILGEKDLLVLETKYLLAETLHDSGEFEEAFNIAEEVLNTRKSIHGEIHPKVADSLNQTGWLLKFKNALCRKMIWLWPQVIKPLVCLLANVVILK